MVPEANSVFLTNASGDTTSRDSEGSVSVVRRVAYLRLGSAVSAHVMGIVGGLRELGWNVEMFEPPALAPGRRRTRTAHAFSFISVQLRLWSAGRRWDAIYIRHHPAALATVLWAKMRRIPVLQEMNGPFEDWVLGTNIPPLVRRCILWVARAGIKGSGAVAVVSPVLRRSLLDSGQQRNVHLIPNAADPRVMHPGATTRIEVQRPYAVWFGFMGWWQGIDTLLDAFHCPEWPREVRLLMIGDGPERPRVEAAAAGDPRLVWLGQLPPADVAALTAGSLAGLSPQNDRLGRSSLGGMSPIKFFETMACGVPVVVTDFPGHVEIVREGRCGLVIPADDPPALARAVAELWRDRGAAAAMGRRGRALVESQHSWLHRARSTAALLDSLIAAAGQRGRNGS